MHLRQGDGRSGRLQCLLDGALAHQHQSLAVERLHPEHGLRVFRSQRVHRRGIGSRLGEAPFRDQGFGPQVQQFHALGGCDVGKGEGLCAALLGLRMLAGPGERADGSDVFGHGEQIGGERKRVGDVRGTGAVQRS